MLNKKEIYKRNCLKHKKNRHKEERKLIYPFVRSMYNFKLHGVKKKHERKLTSATPL